MNSSFFFSKDFCQTPGADLGSIFSDDSPPSYNYKPPLVYTAKIGGCTDGFSSCTESLGFESSEQSITGEGTFLEGRRGELEILVPGCSTAWGRARRRSEERRRVVEFPPPLTSCDERGRRDFVLRPVRKDGRLELTEVRISRPKIMHATRENGRLTLRLVVNTDDDDEEEDQENEAEEGEEEEILIEGIHGEEIKEVGGGAPASGGEGGEAAPRRCYEYDVAGNRYLGVWSPRCCVTTM